ncbi:unnamed protein product [Ranitomeya imitator]|uniref:Uncharacterized protein n=1 Tax=Ranitomeya imitator TaxID=111125 RepID=A0ABN9M2Z5_9NEOB|nr:unnamed protein product [Ranitomeya imitator]
MASIRPPKAPPVKQEGPVQITLKDLLNVKLRRTNDHMDKQMKALVSRQSFPLITVSELQGVKLKIASKMPPKCLTNVFKEKLKSPLDVRQRLRKVNMERSPGGTPLYDRENKENGTGLTPKPLNFHHT